MVEGFDPNSHYLGHNLDEHCLEDTEESGALPVPYLLWGAPFHGTIPPGVTFFGS